MSSSRGYVLIICYSFQTDTHWAVISLLLALSDSPTSVIYKERQKKPKKGVSFKDSQNSLNAIVFKLQVILLMMEVSEKSKSSYYSLSY